MEIKYFQDTDTLLINFNSNAISETRDINENVLIELDSDGNIVSLTLEHAKSIANFNDLAIKHIEY